jgi:hypothetical protein
MKHSIQELFDIVVRYYPRGVHNYDPRYKEAEEQSRLAVQ